MDDTFLDEGHEPVTYLPEYIGSLVLAEFWMSFDKLLEVAIADLLNDVVIVTAFHDIKHLYNVFRLD